MVLLCIVIIISPVNGCQQARFFVVNALQVQWLKLQAFLVASQLTASPRASSMLTPHTGMNATRTIQISLTGSTTGIACAGSCASFSRRVRLLTVLNFIPGAYLQTLGSTRDTVTCRQANFAHWLWQFGHSGRLGERGLQCCECEPSWCMMALSECHQLQTYCTYVWPYGWVSRLKHIAEEQSLRTTRARPQVPDTSAIPFVPAD